MTFFKFQEKPPALLKVQLALQNVKYHFFPYLGASFSRDGPGSTDLVEPRSLTLRYRHFKTATTTIS